MLNPTKDNFTQPLSIQEILDEFEIPKDDSSKTLSVSKGYHLELYLKGQRNSCFANDYFDVGLKAWQANMNI